MKSRLVLPLLSLFVLVLPTGSVAQANSRIPARYTVTDLGTLGGANSFSYAINNSGMVTGGGNIAGQNDMVAQTAFFWDGGSPVNLGTLGSSACPDCSSEGAAASDNGVVAILSETALADPNGEDFCEFNVNRPTRTNHQCLAAIWRSGRLAPLPTLTGGYNAEAFFTNKAGEVVGVSEIGTPDSTCATPTLIRRFEGVRWAQDGNPMPLHPLPSDTVSFAFTNNDVGQIVGISGLCSNVILPPFVPGGPSAPHAVLWDADGTPHDLGTPPGGAGTMNVAVGINNRGQVTMDSMMMDGTIHAFLVTNGIPQDLGTYPADAFITVAPCCNNINDLGQIVGFSLDSNFNQRLLLWQSKDQAPIDLNTVVPADSPWYLVSPAGINDAGEIAATAVNLNTFQVHAVLVSPISGLGPAARGATNSPVLPDNVRKDLQRTLRHY